MNKVFGIALLAGLGAGLAARPHDPFISRGAMREKPRMILISLATDLSVAYDAQTSGLYYAWKGDIQNGNNTYTHQTYGNRGATLYPLGSVLFHNGPGGAVSATPLSQSSDGRTNISFSPKNEALVSVWTASSGTLKADYRGYTVNNGTQTATLRYNLTIGGNVVKVEETPDAASGGGLQRDFKFTGIPAGTSISLQLTGSGVTGVTDAWSATGSGTVELKNGKQYLIQSADGQTKVIGKWN
jgi:hypothetical protein